MQNDTDTGDRYSRNRNSLLILLGLVKLGGMGPKFLNAEVAVQNPAIVSATSYLVTATLVGIAAFLFAGIQIDRLGPRRIALLSCYALMIVYVCAGFAVWIDDGVAGAGLWVLLGNVLVYVLEMAGAVLIVRMIPRSKLPGFNVLTTLPVEAIIFSSIAFVVWNRIMPGIAPQSALFLIGVSLLATIGCAAILMRLAGDGISDHGFPSEAVVAVFERSAPAEQSTATGTFFELWRDASCRPLLIAGVVFTSALATGAPFLIYPETYAVTVGGAVVLVYLALMTVGVLLAAAGFYFGCVRRGLSFGVFLLLCVVPCGIVLCFLSQVQEGLGAAVAIVVLQAGLTGFALALATLFQRLVPVALFGRAMAFYSISFVLLSLVIGIAARATPVLETMDPYLFATICGIALLLTGVMLLLSPLVRKETAR